MSRKKSKPAPSTRQRKPPAPPISHLKSQVSLVSLEDIFNDVATTESYAAKILVEIREALGVGHNPMLSDLPELARRIRQGHERYEKLRVLNPNQFEKLWKEAQRGCKRLDELVDDIEK